MPTKQNPLTFYLRSLLYMTVAFTLRVIAFAPLACLFVFPAGSPLKYLALLCPVLLIFVVLPLRLSFAEALVQEPRQRNFSFDKALGMKLYGEKLCEGLLHALNVAKWGIPLVLMLGGCYYCYTNIDIFTLLSQLGAIGKWVVGAWNTIANFFITLFGSIHTLTYAGGLAEGIGTVVAILGVGLLVLLYGAVRNSATRYVWVLATRDERSPRAEIRRRLRGRRWRQFGVALLNLVLWAPFLYVVAITMKGVLSDVSGNLMMALSTKKLPAVDFATAVAPLVFAFVCLYFPLLPARRYMTAAFATHNARPSANREERKADKPSKPQPAPVPPAQNLFDGLDQQAAPAQQDAPVYTPAAATPLNDGYAELEYAPQPAAEPAMEQPTHDEPTEIPAAAPDGDASSDPSTFTVGQ